MRVLFTVAMVFEGLFGLGFLLAPGPALAPLGVSLDGTSALLARVLGSALLAFAVLLWTARRAADAAEGGLREGASLALLAYYLPSSVLLVVAQLRGQLNALGWIVVAGHAALAAAFGMAMFRGGPAPQQHAAGEEAAPDAAPGASADAPLAPPPPR